MPTRTDAPASTVLMKRLITSPPRDAPRGGIPGRGAARGRRVYPNRLRFTRLIEWPRATRHRGGGRRPSRLRGKKEAYFTSATPGRGGGPPRPGFVALVPFALLP